MVTPFALRVLVFVVDLEEAWELLDYRLSGYGQRSRSLYECGA